MAHQLDKRQFGAGRAWVGSAVLCLGLALAAFAQSTDQVRIYYFKEGTVAVEWQVSDKNLDLRTLRLAYRAQNAQSWTALNIRQLDRAQFSWTPLPGSYEVRLTVADQAGNTTTRITQVKAAGDPGVAK